MDDLSFKTKVVFAFPNDRQNDPLIDALGEKLQALVEALGLEARLDAWVNLQTWCREPARLNILLGLLEQSAEIRDRFHESVSTILTETDGINLFAEVGIPSDRGFTAEFFDRLNTRILPTPKDEHDLAKLLSRIYRNEADAVRFENFSDEFFGRVAGALAPKSRAAMWTSIRAAFCDGFRVLASRVQGQGLSQKLRARSHRLPVRASPFFLIAKTSDNLLEAWLSGNSVATEAQAWREDVELCRKEMYEIYKRLETDGVSVDIVYGLEVLEICLARMELMVQVMEAKSDAEKFAAIKRLLTTLIRANQSSRSLSYLVTGNLRLLHRKIVDRSGQTGEHYIANSRKEYRLIWLAAAGGGLLTTFTAAFKLRIISLPVSPFLESFLAGTNYAVSFLLLQAFGFVLATKQPAMTAATLAAILKEKNRNERLDDIVEFAARICHSQLAAATANVAVVTLGAFLFNYLWELVTHASFLDRVEAQHVMETLSPVNSGTVFYAALTGVILWLSSLVGGWFDNWAVYHRLPLAIRQHWLGDILGRARMNKLADKVNHNIAGWMTSISLGYMLAMAPTIGHFFGIPMDVRHVTLSTGTLALATATLSHQWYHGDWLLLAMAGIATMFVLNLGVSFFLSLFTAVRAYGMPRKDAIELVRRLFRRFFRSPRDFILPPRRSAVDA